MSAIIEPPSVAPAPPAAAPVPAIPAPVAPKGPVLPTGVKVNLNHDAGEFFEKHQAEKAAAGQVAPKAAPAAIAPAAEPAAEPPKPPEKKADVGGIVADSFLPDSAKKQAAPEAKPAEAPVATAVAPGTGENPEDKVVLGKDYSQPAHESFKAIKTIAKGLRDQLSSRDRELTEARAEVEKIKSGAIPVESPEMARLREEHAAMSKRLMVLDLQSHPDYQREFVAPRNAAEQEARNVLEAAGITNVDIPAMLEKDPVAFRKALSDVAAKLPTGLDQADFAAAMRTAHTIRQRAGDAVAKAGDIGKALREKTLNMHKGAFEEAYRETLGSVQFKEVAAPAGAAPEVVNQIEAFNNGVRSIRGEAEKIALQTSDPKAIGVASIKAAAFEFQVRHAIPALQKAIAFRDERIATLENELKGIRARSPNRDVGGMPNAGGELDPSKMNHAEAAEYFSRRTSGGT